MKGSRDRSPSPLSALHRSANEAAGGDLADTKFRSPNRYWIYQKERFPLITHGTLIAALTTSSIGFSSVLREAAAPPSFALLLAAFFSTFLFFLQLRIADEFKDYQEDLRFRPLRPVPRGLVGLQELRVIGIAGMLIQAILTAWVDPRLLLLLLLTWGYMGLMTKEFFIGERLKRHPAAYTLAHMLVVPLIVLYVTAFDWHAAPTGAPSGLAWLLGLSFFAGLALELARKIRAPEEEDGAESYSLLWGRHRAVVIWLVSLGLAVVTASLGASRIGFAPLVGAVGATSWIAAASVGWMFRRRPTSRTSTLLLVVSGITAILMYLCLGVVPLLLGVTQPGG